jgi:hypothetical protein
VGVKLDGPKRDEVAGEWGKRHNEELYDLYCSPNIIRAIKSRRMRWAGHVAGKGDSRCAYKVLVVRLEGESTWKTTLKWEGSVKMDLQQLG